MPSTQPNIVVLSARWVIPILPARTVLEHYCVVIENGLIVNLLPTKTAIKKYPYAEHVQLNTHVLIPGLINTHTHAAMSMFRGYADDLPLDEWLGNHIWPAEQKWIDADFVRDGTELAIAEMIRSGTTLFCDMYFYPNVVASTAQALGIRCTAGLMVMDFPTVWGQGPDEYFDKGLEVHDQVRSLSLVNTMLTPHAPYTVSDEPLLKTLTYADELQIPIQMHIHETIKEIDDATKQGQLRPLARLEQLGLLNPRMMAVHMTQLTDQEIERVAKLGVHVVHCPASNAKLASGMCRVADLISAGVNVSLGTDGAASNNKLDMLNEMRLTALIGKQQSGNASSVSAWQALEMATVNGAKALNLQDNLGSLTIGKFADLCAIDLDHIATQPVYQPVSQLVYSASSRQVSDVWVNGKRILEHGHLKTIDTDQIIKTAKRRGDEVRTTQ